MKLNHLDAADQIYTRGVSNVVLYPRAVDSTYPLGVVWRGITAINQTPSGAEPTDLYADDEKYATLMSAEKLALTIEAYASPSEFDVCDGTATLVAGVRTSQQSRQVFGLAYKTKLGSEEAGEDLGYMWNLVYGCLASPTESPNSTVNDSPEVQSLSWEVNTTKIAMPGDLRPSARLEFDSRDLSAPALAALEEALLGVDTPDTAAYLPMPQEVLDIIALADA